MDIFGNFDHSFSNIVQNVNFLQLKKKNLSIKNNSFKIVDLKHYEFSSILGLTVAI